MFFLLFLPVFAISIAQNKLQGQNNHEVCAGNENGKTRHFNIKIIMDNNSSGKAESAWGFSCLINDSLIFDFGPDYNKLKKNLDYFGAAPGQIKYAALSHIHSDHAGALGGFSKRAGDGLEVWGPKAFLEKKIGGASAKIIDYNEFGPVAGSVYNGGAMAAQHKGAQLKESFLILEGAASIGIITGCAHPGIVNIVDKANKLFPGKKTKFILGGFHLYQKNEKEIARIIGALKDAGVEYAAPCHCTGEKPAAMFRGLLGDGFIEVASGKEFVICL